MDGFNGKEIEFTLRCAMGVQNNNYEIINRTMLRFRPIAPKPVSNDTVSGNSLVDSKNSLLPSKRTKRKYVRVQKNNGYKGKNSNNKNNNKEDRSSKSFVTLQLLPEKPTAIKDQEYLSGCKNNSNNINDLDLMVMSSKVHNNCRDRTASSCLNIMEKDTINGGVSDQTVEVFRNRVTVVESWVTVESVTDTSREGFGCTDDERIKINLENDTCPGLISDGSNRVLWVNESYKKLVMNGDGRNKVMTSPEIEIKVWLVIKEKLPSFFDYSRFTTKVRLAYTWQKVKCSKMVPCDVFRMDGGGFAWRLDVDAALSLGR